MYSYLNVDRGFPQGGLNGKIMKFVNTNSLDLLSLLFKFKLAMFTVPTKALACSMTCDPCQPIKFKEYIRVFIYVGAGYLIHHFHALKPFKITSGRSRTNKYTTGEVPSLNNIGILLAH